ncbi:hypothetical protein B0I33_10950 [Prauserella shujinwangii]|uniref:Uncharacterized protein n=1 Tax=Prauserella shujinwangii TaxID=1453103 RepID=A0A2T0LPV9_9PSEU|nr:hypothetical protein [Prauserella shujinwangii]PRX45387.1 hypothetical protein B0I33_10950 [Prauserella shujinwangii]
MATDHRALAEDYAGTASQTVEAVSQTEDNALQIALVEAVLAVYHQLRGMDSDGGDAG